MPCASIHDVHQEYKHGQFYANPSTSAEESCPPAPACEDDDDEAKNASGGTCAEVAAQGFCEHPQIGPTAKEL